MICQEEATERRQKNQRGPWKRPHLKGGQRRGTCVERKKRLGRFVGKRWAAHYQRGKWERLVRGGRSSRTKLQTTGPQCHYWGACLILIPNYYLDELGKGTLIEVADAEVRLKWGLERKKMRKRHNECRLSSRNPIECKKMVTIERR